MKGTKFKANSKIACRLLRVFNIFAQVGSEMFCFYFFGYAFLSTDTYIHDRNALRNLRLY